MEIVIKCDNKINPAAADRDDVWFSAEVSGGIADGFVKKRVFPRSAPGYRVFGKYEISLRSDRLSRKERGCEKFGRVRHGVYAPKGEVG